MSAIIYYISENLSLDQMQDRCERAMDNWSSCVNIHKSTELHQIWRWWSDRKDQRLESWYRKKRS